jgi:hypothetical protein
MNCEQARAAYSLALDGEPDSLEALRHGMLCEACSAWARELHRLDDALHDEIGGVEEAPMGFADRLMAALPEESPEQLAAAHTSASGDTLGWLVSVAALVAAFEWGGTVGGVAGVLERATPLGQQLVAWVATLPGAITGWAETLRPAGEWSAPSVEPTTLGLALVAAAVLQFAASRGLDRRETSGA